MADKHEPWITEAAEKFYERIFGGMVFGTSSPKFINEADILTKVYKRTVIDEFCHAVEASIVGAARAAAKEMKP